LSGWTVVPFTEMNKFKEGAGLQTKVWLQFCKYFFFKCSGWGWGEKWPKHCMHIRIKKKNAVGFETRALGRCSTTWAMPPNHKFSFRCSEIKTPVKHPNGGLKQADGYIGLGLREVAWTKVRFGVGAHHYHWTVHDRPQKTQWKEHRPELGIRASGFYTHSIHH
jgi:hypothetical protein